MNKPKSAADVSFTLDLSAPEPSTVIKTRPVTFWSAVSEVKKNPPNGWDFVRWPKTESNFTIKSQTCEIRVQNGKDKAKSEEGDFNKDLFYMMIFAGKDKNPAVAKIPPSHLYEFLDMMTKSLNDRHPWVAMPKMTVDDYKAIKTVQLPVIDESEDIDFPVGCHVKIVQSNIPGISKGSIHRVDKRRPGEALLTRWNKRLRKDVSSWFRLECIEIIKDFKKPENYCHMHAPEKNNSALESHSRGYCTMCSEKDQCVWFSANVKK